MGGSIGQIVAGGAANGMAGVQSSIANSPFARAMEAMSAVGQTPTAGAAVTPTLPGSDPIEARRNSIAGLESAGSGDYSAVGPTNAKLGRMLGRYQIAEANIGPWSQEIFGKAMTPDEFLANPKAQDQIFDTKFGQYVDKYGPERAARAWHGGEGNVDNPGARDVLGTSTGDYGQRFMAGMGSDARQTASANVLKYTNQGAQRKQRLDPRLESSINTAVTDVYGPGYTVEVYSGGQASNKPGEGVGSTRHNHGGAGDVYIIGPDGKRLTGDKLAPIAQYWQAKGIGGVGLEMAGGGIHLDQHADRARSWSYGNMTPGQKAAIDAGTKGTLPQMYRDSLSSRMFGGGGAPAGGSSSTGEAVKPGQGEQLQKDLQQRGRRAVTPRGSSGVRMANADSSGGGGVDDSRRRQLLARAKELVPQGRSDRASSRKQAIRARVRGQA